MIILLHSSKTMRKAQTNSALRAPQLLDQAQKIDTYLKTLSPAQLVKTMHISAPLAQKTHDLIKDWTVDPHHQSPALDSFVGDIYRGLRAPDFSAADRDYADKTLRIISGLYGVLRPLDGICPYRLEMAYKFPRPKFASLYKFWGDAIAKCLPPDELIVNVSSLEYMRAVMPFINQTHVVTPEFLTLNPKTGQPTFAAIHAKIARGAFARWLIQSRVTNTGDFSQFTDLNYKYDEKLSAENKPTFVCEQFGGIGLSL